MRISRAVSVLFLFLALPLRAAELTHTEALVTLCKVWSTAKFLHPRLMVRELDWDGALLRAIPAAREAKTHDELANAIRGLLAELDDPISTVHRSAGGKNGPDVPLYTIDGNVLIANLGSYADARGGDALFDAGVALKRALARVSRVVIDVRAEDPHALEAIEWFLEGIGPLTDTQIQGIPKRSVLHSGWAPQVGSSSGGYYSAFVTRPASPVEPATNGRRAPRIVFVARASVPETAAALAASSKAGLISELTLGDDAVGETFSIDAGGGWTASVRTSEAAISGITADAVVAPGRNDSTLAYAVVLARGDAPFAPRTTVARNDLPRRLRDDPYVESPYPELPVRLLALFRFWSVIDWFYPYKDLIGDWDAVLRESIACFEEAADANEYTTAVFRLVASVPDGHSGASGNPALKLFGGTAQIPIEVRAVEGEYVVTAKGYAEGIAIGDVVLAIDGEDLRARVERMRPLFAASTEVARVNRLLALSRRGANDTVARVTVRRTDGSAVTVEVPRVPGYVPRISSGEPWRILEGNVGYVDLTRLTIDRVPAMFDAIMTTRATIFDVRGYPRGTIWAMAPRLNTKRAKTAAQFRRRMISPASLDERESSYEFEQHLPAGDTPLPIYQGRTIALIDDRAISHAEHTCLFLEAANGTTFVGTNTAGANGDITNVVLPGGFTAYFTGHDVRHADGRQLQRVGIVPDIVAAPTLAGLRAGRDEVLERALGLLN